MQIPEKIPANQLPLSPKDREIDLLGAQSNIHEPSDASNYIEAIFAKYNVDSASVPGIEPVIHRLAVAEYGAISDSSKRISEAVLADTFNRMMDEWGTAKWTRITVEDFHRFHRIKAATVIPYSVSRNADGTAADTCRPVEAIYLLYMLSVERGMQFGQKISPLAEDFAKGPMFVDQSKSKLVPFRGDAEANRHEAEYLKARNAWLESHFTPDPAQELDNLLDVLKIS
jgi:hypothetical protein